MGKFEKNCRIGSFFNGHRGKKKLRKGLGRHRWKLEFGEWRATINVTWPRRLTGLTYG